MNSFGKQQDPSRNGSFNFVIKSQGPERQFKPLGEYFNLATFGGLIKYLLSDKVPKELAVQDRTEKPIHAVIREAVIDVTTGCLTTPKLMKYLDDSLVSATNDPQNAKLTVDDLKSQFRQITQINAGPESVEYKLGSEESINDILGIDTTEANSTGDASRAQPSLSSIMLLIPGLSPSVKNTGPLSLFFNSIPPVEFSRAVPFLDVTVQVNRPPLNESQILNSPGLLKFTMGASNIGYGPGANRSIADAARQKLDGSIDEEGNYSTFGMEAFLMPQTMAPFGSQGMYEEMNSPTVRAINILDPFKPVLSVQSLELKVVNSTGIGSYKNAKMVVIIHDRSRLAEVADFIKPDLFGRTDMLIEYGWSHPDGDSNKNPWGAFLNEMRVKEKFRVTNSSFSMEDGGQITVTLDLHMLGSTDYNMTSIAEDSTVTKKLKSITEIQEKIANLLEEAKKTYKDGTIPAKSVFASQIFNNATSTEGELNLDKLRRQLNTVSNRLNALGTDTAKNLKSEIDQLLGQNGAFRDLQNTLDGVLRKKFQRLNGKSSTKKNAKDYPSALIDPYLIENVEKLQNLENTDLKTKKESLPRKGIEVVSFGKLFMTFAGESLLSTGNFADVQVYFYQCNASAGQHRNKNIASFPIELIDFQTKYSKYIQGKRNPHMSIAEFVQFVSTNHFDNLASKIGYGINDYYEVNKEGKVVQRKKVKVKDKTITDPDILSKTLEQKLSSMGIEDGVFKPIQLGVLIEAVPERVPPGSEGEPSSDFDKKTILRIHLYDKASTAYETQATLMNASLDNQLGMFTPKLKDGDKLSTTEAANIVAEAESLNLIEKVDDAEELLFSGGTKTIYEKYKLKGGHQAIKEFVMSTVPYIIYGCQNTVIESLGLTSMQMPEISSINITATPRSAGSITPEGTGLGGVPLVVIPVQMSISTQGCPILSYAQQFFIDVGTGTEIDNIYAIIDLTHNLEPGSFKTTMSMTPQPAYAKYRSAVDNLEKLISVLSKPVEVAVP